MGIQKKKKGKNSPKVPRRKSLADSSSTLDTLEVKDEIEEVVSVVDVWTFLLHLLLLLNIIDFQAVEEPIEIEAKNDKKPVKRMCIF